MGVKRIIKIRLGEKDSLGFGKDKTCVSLSPSSTRGNLRERERESPTWDTGDSTRKKWVSGIQQAQGQM